MSTRSIFFLIWVSITLFGLCCDVFGQQEMKVKAEIVAYDRYASAIRITSAPTHQLLLVRVKKVFKGSDSDEILLVKQISAKLKHPNRHSQNDKSEIRMTLRREAACDATLNSLVFVFQNISGSKEVVSRFEWLRKDIEISYDKTIACYVLIK